MSKFIIVASIALFCSFKSWSQDLSYQNASCYIYGVKITIIDTLAEVKCDDFCSFLDEHKCYILRVTVDSVVFNKSYHDRIGESVECFDRSDSILLATEFVLVPKGMYDNKCPDGNCFIYSGNTCSQKLLSVLNISDTLQNGNPILLIYGRICSHPFSNFFIRIGLFRNFFTRRAKKKGTCNCKKNVMHYLEGE